MTVTETVLAALRADRAAAAAHAALESGGGTVYAVGGVVRDALLGRRSRDVDLVVTGLPPDRVHAILARLPGNMGLTGKKFGVYRYKIGDSDVEVALPRTDVYDSSRRGEGVITVDHALPIEADLRRRDFTVNSAAVRVSTGELVDPAGGARDARDGMLRLTHPGAFDEDPTRLVRALAMRGRFGLATDYDTWLEMRRCAHLIGRESPDALNRVVDKMLQSDDPASAVELGVTTHVLDYLFPEVTSVWSFDQNNEHHCRLLGPHLAEVLRHVSRLSDDVDVRAAALLHDVGKPSSEWRDEDGVSHYYEGPEGQGADHARVGAEMTRWRMRKLNYSTARVIRVGSLVEHHMFGEFTTARGARRFLARVGEHADDLMLLRESDVHGKDGEVVHVERMRELVARVREDRAPTALSMLAVDGSDVLELGYEPGPIVGQILQRLLEATIECPSLNDRDTLLMMADQASRSSNFDQDG